MKASQGRVFGVFLIAALLYLPTLNHTFHYDDFHSIVHNPHLRTLGNLPSFFADPTAFSVDPKQAMYRPMLLVTYALNYAWDDGQPRGYHLVNILLHGLNAALVLLLVEVLDGGSFLALVTGLLFAVHPLNAESVNYVSSRSELLMATFFLGACLGYLRFCRTGRSSWCGVALILAGLALLSKSVAVVLPVVLMLIDGWKGGSAAVKGRWLHYLPFAALGLGYILFTRQLVGKALAEPVRPLAVQAWTQLKAGVYYLGLAAMPVKLNVEHQFFPATWPLAAEVVGAGLLLGSLFFWLIRTFRRLPAFAAFWSAITLIPSSAVPLIVLVNEHRLYLPVVGWCLFLAWIFAALGNQRRRVARLGVGVYTIVLASIAFQRSQIWADECTLWQDAAAKAPLMLKPHLRLGDALAEAGRLAEAEEAYRRAVALRPAHPGARNNLGRLYLRQGRWAEAEAEFRFLLRTSPEVVPARLNLAGLLLRRGNWQEAEVEYRRALDFGDTGGMAQKQLGQIALRFKGDPALAIAYFDQAAAAGLTSDPEVWCSRGVALKALQRLAEAEAAYQRTLELDPQFAEGWFNLGNLYLELGRRAAARRAYEKVFEVATDVSLVDLARKQWEALRVSVSEP